MHSYGVEALSYLGMVAPTLGLPISHSKRRTTTGCSPRASADLSSLVGPLWVSLHGVSKRTKSVRFCGCST
jgi:hypothetical protein